MAPLLWANALSSSVTAADTSLFLPHNSSVVFLNNFNGLANVTNYTIEYWAACAFPPQSLAFVFQVCSNEPGKGFWEDFAIIFQERAILFLLNDYDVDGPSTVRDRAWHHYAATHDSAGLFKFYIDGVLRFSTVSSPPLSFPPNAMIILGQSMNAFMGSFDPLQGIVIHL